MGWINIKCIMHSQWRVFNMLFRGISLHSIQGIFQLNAYHINSNQLQSHMYYALLYWLTMIEYCEILRRSKKFNHKKNSQIEALAKNQLAQNDSFGCNFVCMHLAEIQNISEFSTICLFMRLFYNVRKNDLNDEEEEKKIRKKVKYIVCWRAHQTHTLTHTNSL